MTKRERLAALYRLPIENVCCDYCDRKSKKNEKVYCPWFRLYIKNIKEDYCTFFFYTHR